MTDWIIITLLALILVSNSRYGIRLANWFENNKKQIRKAIHAKLSDLRRR